MLSSLIAYLTPIIFSLLSLWIKFTHGSNKNKTEIIDSLSKELNNKKPNPYIVQACVSRMHSSKPISFNLLEKLLSHNNAFEIIQIFSIGRKYLDILRITDTNNRLNLEYSGPFSTSIKRWMCMLTCAFAFVSCYSTAVYIIFKAMIIVDTMSVKESENLMAWWSIFPEVMALIFLVLIMSLFSWIFIIIATSEKRKIRIQQLMNEIYNARKRSTIRANRSIRKTQ